MNGNAVLYNVGQILTVGGATAYQDAGTAVDVQATRRAYTINISGGPHKPVVVHRTPNMAYARAFSNSVVLPNGEVLVVGGQQHPQTFTDTGAVLSPELWNPKTGKFTIMAPELIARTYHSVALLLPDGRVFSGGGGLCGNGCTANHPNGQIFSPPYLFNANGTARRRPVSWRPDELCRLMCEDAWECDTSERRFGVKLPSAALGGSRGISRSARAASP